MIRQASSRRRNKRSSGDLFQASLSLVSESSLVGHQRQVGHTKCNSTRDGLPAWHPSCQARIPSRWVVREDGESLL